MELAICLSHKGEIVQPLLVKSRFAKLLKAVRLCENKVLIKKTFYTFSQYPQLLGYPLYLSGGSRATICFILLAYDIINWLRILNRIGWKIEPPWNTFALNGWWLPGLLFKQPCRLWTGGSRRLLSVSIVISRSWMSSWANLLLLISLTERKSCQACRVLSPFRDRIQCLFHTGKYDKLH